MFSIGQARLLPERHRPVAVERAAGIHADGERRDLGVFTPAHGEEVAERHLDRWLLLVVPVHAEDGIAPVAGGRHPDVLNRAGSRDLAERERRSGRHDDERIDLPALPELARGVRRAAGRRHGAFAFSAVEILRTDRTGLGVRHSIERLEAVRNAVESPLLLRGAVTSTRTTQRRAGAANGLSTLKKGSFHEDWKASASKVAECQGFRVSKSRGRVPSR